MNPKGRRLRFMNWIRFCSAVLATLGLTTVAQADLFDMFEDLHHGGSCKSQQCAAPCQSCCRPTITRPCGVSVYSYQRQCSDVKPACCNRCSAPEACCEPVCDTCCEPACDTCCPPKKKCCLLGKLFGGHGCGMCGKKSCCEPACDCCQPACDSYCEPACDTCCEPVCDPCCPPKKKCFLSGLFGGHGCGMCGKKSCCEPACDCCQPACDTCCEPACDTCCEPACDPCCKPKQKCCLFGGLFGGGCSLCKQNDCCQPACDACCEPACDTCCEPACDTCCEPACDTCCEPCCPPKKKCCLLDGLFGKAHGCGLCGQKNCCQPACDTCCEPACDTCCEPACDACSDPCCPPKKKCFLNGLFGGHGCGLFGKGCSMCSHGNNCGCQDACCESACCETHCCTADPCEIAELIYQSQTACYADDREDAIDSLGDYDCVCNPEILTAMIHALNDADEEVRAEAADEIGDVLRRNPCCCCPELISALTYALGDCDKDVRKQAEEALEACGYAVVDGCCDTCCNTCGGCDTCGTAGGCDGGYEAEALPGDLPAEAAPGAGGLAPAPAPPEAPKAYYPSRTRQHQATGKTPARSTNRLANLFGLLD